MTGEVFEQREDDFDLKQRKVQFYVNNLTEWGQREALTQLLLWGDKEEVRRQMWICVDENWKAYKFPVSD